MEEASKQINLATFLEIPMKDNRRQVTSTTVLAQQPRKSLDSPLWRMSHRHNGSTLYDSFELQAVTQQLNRAIQVSKACSSPRYMHCLNSPFCKERLDQVGKARVKAPKRILCSQVLCATTRDEKTRAKPPGFATRAWKQVKQGFGKNRQKKI